MPVGSEVSSAVNFGQPSNVPNSEYTTVARIGDAILWELGSNANATDQIEFDRIDFVSGDTIIQDLFELVGGLPVDLNNLSGGTVKLAIAGVFTSELEAKYDLWFYAVRDGVESGPYYIDPKIQIKN